ncbi:MAG: hypothetical protein IJZ29_00365 [Clostridia bacterium]|nr:hypothetical protein [Clostridia bacterium]
MGEKSLENVTVKNKMLQLYLVLIAMCVLVVVTYFVVAKSLDIDNKSGFVLINAQITMELKFDNDGKLVDFTDLSNSTTEINDNIIGKDLYYVVEALFALLKNESLLAENEVINISSMFNSTYYYKTNVEGLHNFFGKLSQKYNVIINFANYDKDEYQALL